MSTRLNRAAYVKMVKEDIAYLEKQPRTLERDHAIMVVTHSIDHYYPPRLPQEDEPLGNRDICLRFEDGPRKGPDLLFVEAELPGGRGINCGSWEKDGEQYLLCITVDDILRAVAGKTFKELTDSGDDEKNTDGTDQN